MTATASNSHASTTLARIAELGIVGAGGGGFPTAVKFKSQAGLLIANAAECEPLLHKDKELLAPSRRAILARHAHGYGAGWRAGGCGWGLKKNIMTLFLFRNTRWTRNSSRSASGLLPAGDEFILVHMVTGRVIPPGGTAEGCGRGGGQCRDVDEHRPRPAGHAQVPHGRWSGCDSADAAGTDRHHHWRSDRRCGRGRRFPISVCCWAAS